MKQVKCKSGLTGWQQRLRKNYDNDFESFKNFCEVFAIHTRLGYKRPETAWRYNPLIEGSVDPSDFRVVKRFKNTKNEKTRRRKN